MTARQRAYLRYREHVIRDQCEACARGWWCQVGRQLDGEAAAADWRAS